MSPTQIILNLLAVPKEVGGRERIFHCSPKTKLRRSISWVIYKHNLKTKLRLLTQSKNEIN